MSAPLVSIVVPTLNQAPYIGETIASIIGQCWPRMEIIVVDGGSTDGTADVVRRFGSAITHFISEKDRGQADAINKGFRLAKGDIFAWLNSDDYYLPGVLDRVVPMLGDGLTSSLLYGGTVAYQQKTHAMTHWMAEPFDREKLKVKDYIYQPSAFWTRALWQTTGELDISKHFILDWDWFVRASEHCNFQQIPNPLSVYRFHEGHKTTSGNPRRVEEVCAFVEKHAGTEWAAAFRDVGAQLPTLIPGLKRLRRFGVYGLRKLIYRKLYKQHGAKVKVALSQLGV